MFYPKSYYLSEEVIKGLKFTFKDARSSYKIGLKFTIWMSEVSDNLAEPVASSQSKKPEPDARAKCQVPFEEPVISYSNLS